MKDIHSLLNEIDYNPDRMLGCFLKLQGNTHLEKGNDKIRSETMIQLFMIIILFIAGVFSFSAGDDNSLSGLEPTSYPGVNVLDGVHMETIEETVTPTGLTLLFENETDIEFTYGLEHVLEINLDGDWYKVPLIVEAYAYEDIGYILSGNESAELVVDWERLYGTLDPGEYRIVKEVLDVFGPGQYERFPLSAEFIIE